MYFANRQISKRKIAFISAIGFNALVTLGQQIFQLNLFYSASGYPSQNIEYVKMSIQHSLVFFLMALCIVFWQQETFWNHTNIKQTVNYYLMLLLFAFTIPLFTYGEHVSSNARQCFIASVMALTYVVIFPPPIIHALIGAYLCCVHYLYRTHAFQQLASLE